MHSTNRLISLTWVFVSVLGVCQCYVNVALNKPAHQQYPFKTNDIIGDASNAVDGQKSNLSRNGGQCVLSAARETATWRVNLTSIHSIQNITIYYMDNKPETSFYNTKGSFLGFSIYVSNTTDKLQGTLCFKDTNFTLDTIPAVFTTICPVHGQYVIYYNERLVLETYPVDYSQSAENNVCEVEVYGCPATGCYGSNNSLPCPDVNCQHCHKETGTCQVCQPGYKGQQCKLECETGKYGVNCSKSCGNCLNQSQCHNVDGSCYEGCSSGYKGSRCTEQCETGKYGVNCLNSCGYCHNQSQCQNVDGSCSEGCSAGYTGSLCTELCEQAFYGINCSQKCNTICITCDHVIGYCIEKKTIHWYNDIDLVALGLVMFDAVFLAASITICYMNIRRLRKMRNSEVEHHGGHTFQCVSNSTEAS